MRNIVRLAFVAGLAAAVSMVGVGTAPPAHADPPFFGSLGGLRLNAPVTAIARTQSSNGYYLFAEDGGVFAFGDAAFRGSLGGVHLNGRVVDGARSTSGNGYYMVGADGGVFSFGDAPFHGSLGALHLVAPVVGMDVPSARSGYAMVGADGGAFVFGALPFAGSLAGRTGGVAAVDIAVRPGGDGYWILLADGRVFAFGAAPALGNTPGLTAPASAIVASPDGAGYTVFSVDGGAFAFGSARFHGSVAGSRLNGPIVDAALTASGDGYWMLGRDGGVFGFPGPGLPPGGTPHLTITPVVSGLSIPWDLGFLPDGSMLWTERAGTLKALVNGAPRLLAAPGDVRVGGEGGMLGLAIDPDFTNNRRVYTCFDTTGGDVKVVVWTVDAAVTTATRVGTLVAGIPENPSGRHSGCRPRVGPDGYLWIGTGDAATGTNPQDVNSLGGKVLRVDRFSGAAAAGNPFGLRWYTRWAPQRPRARVPPGHRRSLFDRARYRPRRRSEPARVGRELRLEPGAGLRREQADDVRGWRSRDLEQRLSDDRHVRCRLPRRTAVARLERLAVDVRAGGRADAPRAARRFGNARHLRACRTQRVRPAPHTGARPRRQLVRDDVERHRRQDPARHAQLIYMLPPSTPMRWPVTYDACSETTKRTASATSSGVHTCPNGLRCVHRADVLDAHRALHEPAAHLGVDEARARRRSRGCRCGAPPWRASTPAPRARPSPCCTAPSSRPCARVAALEIITMSPRGCVPHRRQHELRARPRAERVRAPDRVRSRPDRCRRRSGRATRCRRCSRGCRRAEVGEHRVDHRARTRRSRRPTPRTRRARRPSCSISATVSAAASSSRR